MVGEKKEAKELCEQGYAFYNGKGVPKDPKKAVALWQRAAELGKHFPACLLFLIESRSAQVMQEHKTGLQSVTRMAKV